MPDSGERTSPTVSDGDMTGATDIDGIIRPMSGMDDDANVS